MRSCTLEPVCGGVPAGFETTWGGCRMLARTDHETFTQDSLTSRFREAMTRLEAAQKPGAGVPAYTRWVNRRLARGVASFGYAARLQPNSITVLSAVLSFAGILLLVTVAPNAGVGLIVAALLAAGYVFDSADGQLARLYGRPSLSGEWLDHVVDSIRTPAIHVAVAVAVMRFSPEQGWVALVAVVYCLVTSGQFLSQILAEALVKSSGVTQTRGGTRRSLILLPTDPGVLCWSFVLWGFGAPFFVLYVLLAFVAVVHGGVSMQRRFRELSAIDAARQADHA